MSLLKSTLQSLAEHKTASERYLVVLAMEATEDGHEAKALKLAEEYKGRQVLKTGDDGPLSNIFLPQFSTSVTHGSFVP